jgi:hypothetical protein
MLALLGRLKESYESLRMAVLLDQSLAQLAQTDSDLSDLRKNTEIKPLLATMGVTSPLSEDLIPKSVRAGE